MANVRPDLSSPFVKSVLVFLALKTVWTVYLDFRQLFRTLSPTVPPHVRPLVSSDEEFFASMRYSYDKLVFSIVSNLFSFFSSIFQLLLAGPALWNHLVQNSDGTLSSEVKTTCLWIFGLTLMNLFLGEVLLDFYSDFVVEAKHGFNKKTVFLFISDFFKVLGLKLFFVPFLIAPLIALVRKSDPFLMPIFVWFALQVFIVIFMFIFPNFIQPLFNKYEPLQNEDLKVSIEEMARNFNFPLKKLFQVDGSTRSSHSNAYMYGFGANKRIVLYDTLLTLEKGPILAILLHEIGHWFHNHVISNLVLTSVYLALVIAAYSWFVNFGNSFEILASFGYEIPKTFKMVPFMIGIDTISNLLAPLVLFYEKFLVLFSRRNEFQADKFATDNGKGEDLKKGLVKIMKENKSNLNPDPLYSWWHYTHPTLGERLLKIDENLKKKT